MRLSHHHAGIPKKVSTNPIHIIILQVYLRGSCH